MWCFFSTCVSFATFEPPSRRPWLHKPCKLSQMHDVSRLCRVRAQWCESGPCSPSQSCWIGSMADCQPGGGWVSRGRNTTTPSNQCQDPGCEPSTCCC